MDRKRWLAVAAAAALGGLFGVGAGACGDDGEVDRQGGTTGKGTGTTTTPTVSEAATDPAALAAAMDAVAKYAREQTEANVAATEKLQRAIDSGDVDEAKQAYQDARPYYERIEPLVALFPELDGKIDAREDDFPKKAADPTWTGFHPIERQLFRDEKITDRTKELAAGLVADSERLDELMAKATVTPEVVIPGTAELIDEVEESKITGEEERYSKLDLPTFVANLEGGKAFYEPLAPLVEKNDAELNEQVNEAFDAAFAQVNELKQDGDFVAYDELTPEQQKAIKQRIEALAEALARVQGTLGVKS